MNQDHLLKWLTWEMPDKCNTCNIMPLCKGRCPELSLDKTDFECHQLKFNIKDRLFRYYERTRKEKVKVNDEVLLES